MSLMTGFSNQLTADIKSKMFKYRYDVFIDTLGWELDVPKYLEKDQFDQEDTLYVLAKNDEGDVIGCSRLLPTTGPYLLEQVFPELLNGMKAPKSSDIWEVSRFTNLISTPAKQRTSKSSRSDITEISFAELLDATIKCAKQQGANKLLSVSPIGIDVLLRKSGIEGQRLGPPKVINNRAIIACLLHI